MKDFDYIKNIDDNRLAKIWCELNKWDWPKEIPYEEKPEEWNILCRRQKIMDKIRDRIGHKAISREWNIDRMTDEEHEEWFNRTY